MPLPVASLFAGIGGFDLAALRAGANILWSAEIDPDARAVLAARFPSVTHLGDVREITPATAPAPAVIVGGFPCQDVSVAGLRAGLAGNRSGLFWEIVRLLDDFRPRWVVLENVPGLLSSNGGRDMGAVVGALAQRGYGWAYRVLDARFFGVPQRRRRVFIVGCLGDAASSVRVLFESEGVRRDTAAGDSAGPDPATPSANGPGGPGGFEWHDGAGYAAETASPLMAERPRQSVVAVPAAFEPRYYTRPRTGGAPADDVSLRAGQGQGDSAPVVAVAFRERGRPEGRTLESQDEVAYALTNPGAGGRRDALTIAAPMKHGRDNQTARIFDAAALAPTLQAQDDRGPAIAVPLLTLNPGDHQAKRVYGTDGVAPALSGMDGRGQAAPTVAIPQPINLTPGEAQRRCVFDADGPSPPLVGLDGRGSAAPTVAVALNPGDHVTKRVYDTDGLSPTLVAIEPPHIAAPIPLQAVTMVERAANGSGVGNEGDPMYTLDTYGNHGVAVALDIYNQKLETDGLAGSVLTTAAINPAVAQVQWASGGGKLENDTAQALRAGAEVNYQFVRAGYHLRRLTPRECERLQGFPDDWSAVERNGKILSNSARYRLLGNAVAVPVVEWLMRRLVAVDEGRDPDA